jgi:hypothetical protein
MLFDGGSDFAQRGVELGLTGVEVATGASLERKVLALDIDIAQVSRGGHAGEQGGRAGDGEGVGVVASSVYRDRAHGGQVPSQRGGNLDVHPGTSGLGREQIGDVPPVPGGADRAPTAPSPPGEALEQLFMDNADNDANDANNANKDPGRPLVEAELPPSCPRTPGDRSVPSRRSKDQHGETGDSCS